MNLYAKYWHDIKINLNINNPVNVFRETQEYIVITLDYPRVSMYKRVCVNYMKFK